MDFGILFFWRIQENFALNLLRLAWIRTSVDLVGSKVLPVVEVQVDAEGVSTLQSRMKMSQGFKGSERKRLLRSKVKTCRNLEEITRGSIGARSTR